MPVSTLVFYGNDIGENMFVNDAGTTLPININRQEGKPHLLLIQSEIR
jgi:hypothetical protein